MASGNATFTYTGKELTISVSGETFIKGEPTHTADNGVIAILRERDDFTEVKPEKAKAPEPAQPAKPTAASVESPASPVATEAAPKPPAPAPASAASKLEAPRKPAAKS